jgi:ribosomal protein S3
MARQVVTKAGLLNTGDPDMRPMSRGGGGGTSVSTLTTGATFNIAPVINVNGSANPHVDAQVIAHEVTMIIEREMRLKNMRNA